jgi:hypothetical protein
MRAGLRLLGRRSGSEPGQTRGTRETPIGNQSEPPFAHEAADAETLGDP